MDSAQGYFSRQDDTDILVRSQDTLAMEKYHFITVITNDRRLRIPRLEWPLIPFGFFVGTFFTYVTADFHDTANVPRTTIAAIAIIFMAFMVLLAVAFGGWWLAVAVTGLVKQEESPNRDPGDLWESVKDQVARDNARAAARKILREGAAAVELQKATKDLAQSPVTRAGS